MRDNILHILEKQKELGRIIFLEILLAHVHLVVWSLVEEVNQKIREIFLEGDILDCLEPLFTPLERVDEVLLQHLQEGSAGGDAL